MKLSQENLYAALFSVFVIKLTFYPRAYLVKITVLVTTMLLQL